MNTWKVKIGIIGGPGFDGSFVFENPTEHYKFLEGRIKDVECVYLARHGRNHDLQPSDVDYRENILDLTKRGCTHILAMTAARSLREDYRPGDLVVVDDYIDRTWGRKCTYFDKGAMAPCNLPQAQPFCATARAALVQAARARELPVHEAGTVVVIEGPRFPSRAESLMYRQWGGHLVDMTTMPEVVLANESRLSYAALAVITDYDSWRQNEPSVSVSEAGIVKKAADVIAEAVQILAVETELSHLDARARQTLVLSSIIYEMESEGGD